MAASAQTLLAQLQEVTDHPEKFAARSVEITKLARKEVVALEGPFETFQRLAYSVSVLLFLFLGGPSYPVC